MSFSPVCEQLWMLVQVGLWPDQVGIFLYWLTVYTSQTVEPSTHFDYESDLSFEKEQCRALLTTQENFN